MDIFARGGAQGIVVYFQQGVAAFGSLDDFLINQRACPIVRMADDIHLRIGNGAQHRVCVLSWGAWLIAHLVDAGYPQVQVFHVLFAKA